MGGFIEGMARRLRKHNGALLVGTQSVLDFEDSSRGKGSTPKLKLVHYAWLQWQRTRVAQRRWALECRSIY